MRGTLYFRSALFGLALSGLTVFAQTPATNPPSGTVPAKTTPSTAPANSPTTKTPAISPTTEAAKVNGEAIYEVAVQRALEHVPIARRAEERPRLINYLVDNLLIDQSLRAAGYKVEQADVDKRVTDMKTELKKNGKDFDKMLTDLRVSETELKHHIAADLRWYKYASAQATDKALNDLFTAAKDMFDGTEVKARHILISTTGKDEQTTAAQLTMLKKTIETEAEAALTKVPATADKLTREKARTGALVDSFAKYAKEKSECPTKNNGGDVGWFKKSGYMVVQFSEAAFASAPFQITNPVKTPFGYHLIMVTERKPGRDVKFADVKEIVKEVYFDRLHDGLAAQLRPKANIVIHTVPK